MKLDLQNLDEQFLKELIAALQELDLSLHGLSKFEQQVNTAIFLTSKIVEGMSEIEKDRANVVKHIITAYNSDKRYWHTANHVNNMIEYVANEVAVHQIHLSLEDMLALYIAIIYHDVVYEYGVEKNFNETASANKFIEDFKLTVNIDTALHIPWAVSTWGEKVVRLIMATTGNPWDVTTRIDLENLIVNADWSQYEDYTNARLCDVLIEMEVTRGYGFSQEDYIKGRTEFKEPFLKKFKERPEIIKNDIRAANFYKIIAEH